MGGPGRIDGESHSETDNFQYCTFRNEDGVTFHSAEQYFQWCKCVEDGDRQSVLRAEVGMGAWSAGSRVKLRPDWEVVKVRCMMDGNRMKFEQNPELLAPLLSTTGRVMFGGSSTLVQQQWFSWSFWNGRIMEYLRAHFRKDGEEDEATIAEFERIMGEYEEKERRKL